MNQGFDEEIALSVAATERQEVVSNRQQEIDDDGQRRSEWKNSNRFGSD